MNRLSQHMRAAALLVAVALMLAPQAAWADALVLSGSGSMSLAAVDVAPLPIECTPASIETGIPCGMTEMCGQDPCLCGAVDDWGACACNGTRTTRPSWALSLGGDAGDTVHLVDFAGRTWVVSLGLGGTSADGVLSASLVHYEGASMRVHVDVAPFGVLDLLKVVAALLAVFFVFFALGAGARAFAGWLGGKAANRRGRARKGKPRRDGSPGKDGS